MSARGSASRAAGVGGEERAGACPGLAARGPCEERAVPSASRGRPERPSGGVEDTALGARAAVGVGPAPQSAVPPAHAHGHPLLHPCTDTPTLVGANAGGDTMIQTPKCTNAGTRSQLCAGAGRGHTRIDTLRLLPTNTRPLASPGQTLVHT